MSKQTWFSMTADADKKRCALSIFDEIGGWGVTPAMFAQALADVGPVDAIELHLNSPGGSVIDGMAIYNLLNAHPAEKTVYVDGWAASMASIIAMVGKTAPRMPSNTWLMIHNPWAGVAGDSEELRKYADTLDKMKEQAIGAYGKHATVSREELAKLMDAETWLTAEEAAAAKLLGTEMQNRLLDDFLQMHGGYGYMAEYDIGRAWADARVGRIYGGSSEVMREIIARTL
jgi:ATP-dependent Clp endopeptidase proteolytic subunit ClpP